MNDPNDQFIRLKSGKKMYTLSALDHMNILLLLCDLFTSRDNF